ncbi:MAG: NCS2 family permease [Candidatus Zixiibacteriota bacterium]
MLRTYFKLDELSTTVRQEVIAGFTTFVTMAYIIIVNPKILEIAGIPFGPSMVATVLSAFFGTLTMGIYARRPFAIAPYMGENAFIAVTVCKVLGYNWQTALGAIFISGVFFTLITIFKIRSWLANSIPEGLKIGCAVGIGLYLTFIGLNDIGVVTLGVEGSPVKVGDLSDLSVLLAIFGFLLISFLMLKNVNGAMLIGILTVTVLAFISGLVEPPSQWVSLPPDIGPIFLELDILGALHWGFFAVILTVLVADFIDTLGTLMGVSYIAGFLDKDGNLPQIEKPMLCDALATVVGALLGTTTSGTFLESAAGIKAGGKSGLTSVVTAFLFLTALFFAPFFSIIPTCAYGPALIVVGMLMITAIRAVKFSDMTETVPVFGMIIMMSFTYNLAIGLTAGFLLYPLMKLIAGRYHEISFGLWVLGAFSLLFFIFYPYG